MKRLGNGVSDTWASRDGCQEQGDASLCSFDPTFNLAKTGRGYGCVMLHPCSSDGSFDAFTVSTFYHYGLVVSKHILEPRNEQPPSILFVLVPGAYGFFSDNVLRPWPTLISFDWCEIA
jgi:hypothetical protein